MLMAMLCRRPRCPGTQVFPRDSVCPLWPGVSRWELGNVRVCSRPNIRDTGRVSVGVQLVVCPPTQNQLWGLKKTTIGSNRTGSLQAHACMMLHTLLHTFPLSLSYPTVCPVCTHHFVLMGRQVVQRSLTAAERTELSTRAAVTVRQASCENKGKYYVPPDVPELDHVVKWAGDQLLLMRGRPPDRRHPASVRRQRQLNQRAVWVWVSERARERQRGGERKKRERA